MYPESCDGVLEVPPFRQELNSSDLRHITSHDGIVSISETKRIAVV